MAQRSLNGRIVLAERNVSSPNRERRGSIYIAEHDPQARATDAGVNNLAQCLIVEVHERGCRGRTRRTLVRLEGWKSRTRRRWSLGPAYFGCRPRADPSLAASALPEHCWFHREQIKSGCNECNQDKLPF